MRSGPKNDFFVVVVVVVVVLVLLGFLSPRTLIGRFLSRDRFILAFIGSEDYRYTWLNKI